MKTKISITKAAELAEMSRNSFYTNYLKTGMVSQGRYPNGRPYIDLSELVRVFPNINPDNENEKKAVSFAHNLSLNLSEKDDEIRRLQNQIHDQKRENQDRERWYKEQIERYQLLLEHQNNFVKKGNEAQKIEAYSLIGRVFRAITNS